MTPACSNLIGRPFCRDLCCVDTRKILFVVPVGYHNATMPRKIRIAVKIHLFRRRCGKNQTRSIFHCFSFDPKIAPASQRISRIIVFRHRVPEVGKPRQSRQAVQRQTDQMSGCDRIGGPQNVGPLLTNQRQPARTASIHQLIQGPATP